MNKRKVFGKKLEVLLDEQVKQFEVAEFNGLPAMLQNLAIEQLCSGTYQPRKHFKPEALQELAQSIKTNGIVQPIIARKNALGYEIVTGERRWQAAKLAGLTTVPVIVTDISNESALAFGLIENIQRQNLNPIEEAEAFQRLQQEFAMTHDTISKAVGRSRATISNMLRLLELTEPVKNFVREGKIDMGHARALLGVVGVEQQLELAQLIIEQQLSVRRVEFLIRKLQSGVSKKGINTNKHQHQEMPIIAWEQQLSAKFDTRVNIVINQRGEGKVEVRFNDRERLNKIISHLTD